MKRISRKANSWSMWRYRVLDFYKPLESTMGWKLCPVCWHFPRVWEFDNGRHAKCQCQDLYGSAVRAEGICEWMRRTGSKGFVGYPENALRDEWNKYVTIAKSLRLGAAK